MTRPIVPLLIALMAGILVGDRYAIPDQISQVTLAIALLFVLISYRLQWHNSFHLFVLLFFFLIGFLVMGMYAHPSFGKDHLWHRIGEGKVSGEGIICENPRISPEKTELVVSVHRILKNEQYLPVAGRLLLRVRNGSDWEYGDLVRFHTRLREPHNFQNPGGFDYERYLRLRRILVVGSINAPTEMVLLRKKQGNPLFTRLEGFRDMIRNALRERAPDAEGRIIQAMTLGEKREIPRGIIENFNKTGTAHLIAISGLHVGIVAFACLFMTRWFLSRSEYLLLRWNIEKIASFAAMLTVIFYMFVAGAGISVTRATIMVLAFMTAILFNRDRDMYQMLALAAFLILLISPGSLFDVSFQLSFTAVLAIIFLAPRLVSLLPAAPLSPATDEKKEVFLSLSRKGLQGVVVFGFVSLSATLGTLPLVLFYFNRLSIVSLAANLLVVPILGLVATPLFLLTVMAIPISGALADAMLTLSLLPVKIALFLIDHLAALPFSAIYLPTPTISEMTAFYLFLIALGFVLDGWHHPSRGWTATRKSSRFWYCIGIGAILFCIINSAQLHLRGLRDTSLSLTVMDVGQGNAVLVRFPGGGKMLVDGGGFYDESFDIGRFVLAPYLWHQRIDRIETVVLSHPHPDHLQGLLFVLEHFNVRAVWTNGDVSDSPLYQNFLMIVRKLGITVKTMTDATPVMNIEGVLVRTMNPISSNDSRNIERNPAYSPSSGPLKKTMPPYTKQKASVMRVADDTNDRSLVIKLTYRDRSFLLPADITSVTENRLVLTGADLKSDVLLVPHHGSGYSSSESFIRMVGPLIGVISCGRDNIHRFPHREVLERYQRIKTEVFRTDRDGAISVETDGKILRVSHFGHQRR